MAHTVCAALRRRLPGYPPPPDSLQRRFLSTSGHILNRRDETIVRLDWRTYSPVLRQADLPNTITIPWLAGRTPALRVRLTKTGTKMRPTRCVKIGANDQPRTPLEASYPTVAVDDTLLHRGRAGLPKSAAP